MADASGTQDNTTDALAHDILRHITPNSQVNTTLFAKVGNGKSSCGNTLLRAWGYRTTAHGYSEPGFEARRDTNSVTQTPETIEHTRNGVTLRVTDQVGLLDARGAVFDEQQLRDTALSQEHQDGYHVIFILLKITDRIDAAEQIILGVVRRFYGEEVGPHIVLLLTHADTLDSCEEITRLVAGAKSSVEEELGQTIARAIPVNNHLTTVAPNGQGCALTGTMMIEAIRDVVEINSRPFEPPEVDVQEVRKYIEDECSKRKLDFNKIFSSVHRSGGCNIL